MRRAGRAWVVLEQADGSRSVTELDVTYWGIRVEYDPVTAQPMGLGRVRLEGDAIRSGAYTGPVPGEAPPQLAQPRAELTTGDEAHQ